MTPPLQTGDPVRDAENMRNFSNQYAQMYGSDNARQMGYTGPDLPGAVQSGRPDLGVQTMNPGQMSVARGPSSPADNGGPLAGGPLASGIFGATPSNTGLISAETGVTGGTLLNPGQPIPDPQPRVGAFEPPPISNGGGMFSFPNVERGENVPDWMVNNPNYNPMAVSSPVMREHTNPATGESYMGTGAGQYMVDPSLTGEFTTPDRSFSLDMGEIPEARNGSPGEGVGPTFGTQQPEVQDFGAQHRAQHEAMGDNGGGNYFGNGGGGGSMGGGVMGLPSALSFQNSYSMPTWMNSSAMNNPFNFASPGGYQTSSPFGSMSSPFGGGLPRGYYT